MDFQRAKVQRPIQGAFWVAGLETLESSSMVRADNPKIFYIRRLWECTLVYLINLFTYCAVRYHLHNLVKSITPPWVFSRLVKITILQMVQNCAKYQICFGSIHRPFHLVSE